MALDHIPAATVAVDRVLRHGDGKHGARAWDNNKPDAVNFKDHLDGLRRHLARLDAGEMVDESGEPTLAHVIARGLLALEFLERMRIKDTCGRTGPERRDKHGPFNLSCGLIKGHNGRHFDRGWHAHWD
jgi:hypothetical protein